MRISRTYFLLLLLIIFQFILLSLSQFTAWPEMLSYPYLLINGFKNYQDIINPYPPLLTEILGVYYRIFGISLLQLKFFTYLIILISDLCIIYICNRFFTLKKSVIVLLLYIPLQIVFEGNGLWFDLFLTPFYLLISVLVLNIFDKENSSSKTYILLGILLGISAQVKQTIIFLFLLLLFYFLLKKEATKKSKQIILCLLSLLLTLSVSVLLVLNNNTLNDFIYWVIVYPYSHIQSAGFGILPTTKQLFILGIYMALPVTGYFLTRGSFKAQILLIFFVSSLFFALPRYSPFHLQPSIPFFALLIGTLSSKVYKSGAILLKLVSIGFVLSLFLIYYPTVYLKEARFYDKKTQEIANMLGSQLRDKGPVFIYNLSSEYFVIGNFLPTKPWVDTFPWYLETKDLQNRIIDSINKPEVKFGLTREFGNEGEFVPGSYIPSGLNSSVNNTFQKVGEVDNIWILERK